MHENSTSRTHVEADRFEDRHIGPTRDDARAMLVHLGLDSLDALIDEAIPPDIRFESTLDLAGPWSEEEALDRLRELAAQNEVFRSYLGQGFHGCITPAVILRNLIENPQWYTPYTPYQAEVAQGRMEALLNFQTLVVGLTGMHLANASLLDESTAAAEAMTLCFRLQKRKEARTRFFVQDSCHPQTLDVLRTRAAPLGIEIQTGALSDFAFDDSVGGVLIQCPDSSGRVFDYQETVDAAHAAGARAVVATDLLALTLLKPPGEYGADLVVGNTQRLGMPMGFGGPHAGFLAASEEGQRQLPGRIVGISRDREGRPAFRLALQTREQHIRRDKATSNICTAQALPAIVASMFAVYHGPDRLRQIALNVHLRARTLAGLLAELGYVVAYEDFFDTIRLSGGPRSPESIRTDAEAHRINLRYEPGGAITIALDQTVSLQDLVDLYTVFGGDRGSADVDEVLRGMQAGIDESFRRVSPFMEEAVFNQYHSETELMRYMDRLQSRDIGLTDSMIPLGSCTMKLNAAAEMIPVTLPGFSALHPFAPAEQTFGYRELITDLELWLAELTGFKAMSLQPNAGSQGEYAGLLAIRAWHAANNEPQREVCLIPMSAHGTNPASAVMAGMTVVGVNCDDAGNIDLDHLRAQAEKYTDTLAALMITYPSTHGVFEETIRTVCSVIHEFGGQVYLDGANMNAMVGLCRPGDFGADVCHLNLHKTFCIPHGGGGPGMGPIGVAAHLEPFLPAHLNLERADAPVGAVSQSPWGSGCILPISWAYIAMMGQQGLARATRIAILNANYIAHRLDPHFPVLYKGRGGRVAHECIIDCRPCKAGADIEVEDIAKRLMDFGFHAPTMSWPVPGTLMIEPTESESKAELDRFCDALVAIREEIAEIENGAMDRADNPLKNAPHTARMIAAADWNHPYTREKAAYPAPWTLDHKFWPDAARIDNVYGDRHLVCTCAGMDSITE